MFSSATHNKANAKSSNSNLFQKEQGEGAFIQAKLKVGKPGDKYEVEADNVAEKVVEGNNKSNGPENKSSFFSPAATPTIQKQEDTEVQEKSIAETITPTVQLAPVEEEVQKMEEENVQSKKEEESIQSMEEEESIQAKEDEEVQAKLNIPKKPKTNLSSRIQSAKGKGSPMPSDLKTNMESGFGADFSGVKIHTGSESAAMNKDLGAKAFTNKNDIFFNEGKFNPQSKDGQTLIAHELTHTIQQGASKPLEAGKAVTKSVKSGVVTKEQVETVKEGTEQGIGKTDSKAVEGKSKDGAEVEKKGGKKGEEAKAGKKGKGKKEAAPVTTTPRNPKEDPNFKKLEGRVDKTAKGQQDHEDSKASAGAAQSAAVSPDNERESMAQSGQVEAMDAAEPGTFNAEDFKAKLMKRIEGMQLPANQDEAANFEDNNNIDEVNSAATGDVEGEKAAAAGPVEETAKQEPNVAAIPEREVKPLPEAPVGKKPPTTNPTKAMPPKRGNAEVNKPLQDNMSEVDQQMTENEVTDEQLAKSNEPSFKEGLDAKGKAKENTENAPGELRKKEQGVLQSTKAGAKGKEQTGLAGMHQDRAKLLKQVTGSQTKTGTTDTSERTRIATEINKIYEKSKTDVEKILSDLDTRVKILFTAGTFLAKRKFEQHVDAKMSAYKSRRYSGLIGAGRWLKDKFAGMPDEVNDFFVTGRQVYIDEMDKVITIVANLVATKLTEAKRRVATGKQEVQDYVKSLPENLQKIGKEAAEEINDKFDELEDSVNSKQDELVDSLAEQYMEGLNAVDARIEEMKAANRGLIDAALGFINGIIETIKKLKELITTLLAEIQNAIGVIMEDPIGFVSTLFEGVGKGIDMFMANIQKHMLGGFITWLTGAMGPVGITIPDNLFSLQGIFSLVMQVLGLSWDFMRKKSVLLLGEPMVVAMEKGFEMFQIIRTKGVTGMWEHMKEQFTDLKETIIDSIKSMLITQVIEAGIKWLLSLLIPGAGFIKAIMAIKDLIVFFVESAIMLIPSLIEAIRALASGNVSGVSKAIEKGLAMLLPLVIGLFAKLIGLGGLVKKVQKIIKKVRKRIDRAVTKLIKKAKKKFSKIFSKKKPKKGQAKKIKEDNKKGKPGKITSKDKAKHKKIAKAIRKKLTEKSKKKHKDFSAFYKDKKTLAKNLEDKYQPQLKKGINLDIKAGSLAKEKKDNDIDFKIKIHPNDENQKAEVVYESGQDITNESLVAELEKLPASTSFEKAKGIAPKLNAIVKKEALNYDFTRITLKSGSDKTHFIIQVTEVVKTVRKDDKRKKDTAITKVGTIKIKRETKKPDSKSGAPDINQFLVEAKKKYSDGSKKTTIDAAEKLHQKLRKVEGKKKIADLDAYIIDLNKLSKLLSELSGVDQDLPDSTYEFNQDGEGRAIKAEAKKLSTKTGPGTGPEADILGWNYVTDNLNSATKKLWVRLHLINEKKFGGRGGSPNLVPGTKNNNSDHLANFENKLKKWLDKKEGESFRVAGLEANVSHYAAGKFDNDKHHHINVAKGGVKPKSEWYANKIVFTAKEFVEKSGNWEKGTKNAVNPLTLNIPLPNFDAASVPALPTITGEELIAIANAQGANSKIMGKEAVKNFLRREVFSSNEDLSSKLDEKGESYGISSKEFDNIKNALKLMVKPGILTY